MSNINAIFGSILENSSNSNVTAYPQNLLNRSGYYILSLIQLCFHTINHIITVKIHYVTHKAKAHLFINLILLMVWSGHQLPPIQVAADVYKKYGGKFLSYHHNQNFCGLTVNHLIYSIISSAIVISNVFTLAYFGRQ